MDSLRDGLMAHGILGADDPESADFVVTWGHSLPTMQPHPNHLYLEAGYINGHSGNYRRDRLRFVSASWGALHGRAITVGPECPPDRFKLLEIQLRPWRTPVRSRALVCGQHPGDKMSPPESRFRMIVGEAHRIYDHVDYRPHPLTQQNLPPLWYELRDYDVAITWSSTSAVESVLCGVPTVALDQSSIAWPVCSHRLTDPLFLGDRDQWAYDLAYRQWTHDELSDGTAWEWLKYGIEQNDSTRAGTGNA